MNRLHITVVAAAVTALAPGRASAQSPTGDPCPGETQLALNECAFQRYMAADAELNHVYRAILGAETGVRAAALRSAQRAWVRFRDAQCAYVAAKYEGMSMQLMQRSSCLEGVTLERIEQLRNELEP